MPDLEYVSVRSFTFFLIQILIINQNANTDICHCKSPRDFIFTKITNPTGQDPLMEASEVLSFSYI